MKRLLFAALGVAALLSPALASDLPLPRAAGPMAPLPVRAPGTLLFNWGGLYAGVNLGGAWGDADGVIGGGQIGYNWNLYNLVFGVETDLQGSGQSSNSTVGFAGAFLNDTQSVDWFGTTRLRVGYPVMDRWLPYFTIGLAYGTRSFSGVAGGALAGAYSASSSEIGWAIGVGVDYAINQSWFARLEYLHVNLSGPTNTYVLAGGTAVVNYGDLDSNIFRAAINYRIMP